MAVFGLNDPPGYSTLGPSLQFLTEFGTPRNGRGNKRRDAVIPKRFWQLVNKNAVRFMGPIPSAASITTATH
ncbi:unnamed protein product, partial [Pylaiella littoralis]